MNRRRLPIGIQTFREIREQDCYYVDKTAYVRRLLDEGKHYFLSRPRRFGKSLFLDTCKELFEGAEALFAGLAIHEHWDWSVRFNGNVYPFELKVVETAGEGAAMAQLKERRYADKYRGTGEPIHLVAVEFSRDARNVAAFEVEPA